MALSVERAASNQVLIREVNERIAELTGPLVEDGACVFVCECSHEDCAEAIEITLAEYETVRADRARFLIALGHEISGIERIVEENNRFAVVEKIADARLIAVNHDPRQPAEEGGDLVRVTAEGASNRRRGKNSHAGDANWVCVPKRERVGGGRRCSTLK